MVVAHAAGIAVRLPSNMTAGIRVAKRLARWVLPFVKYAACGASCSKSGINSLDQLFPWNIIAVKRVIIGTRTCNFSQFPDVIIGRKSYHTVNLKMENCTGLIYHTPVPIVIEVHYVQLQSAQ